MELVQVEKKLTTLQTERDAHASRVEEMETELASVNQELNELQIQCENKDEQVCYVLKYFQSVFLLESLLDLE